MIFEASKKHKNIRVDIFIQSQIKDISRNRIKNIILDGNLKINDLVVLEPSKKIKENDKVRFEEKISFILKSEDGTIKEKQ